MRHRFVLNSHLYYPHPMADAEQRPLLNGSAYDPGVPAYRSSRTRKVLVSGTVLVFTALLIVAMTRWNKLPTDPWDAADSILSRAGVIVSYWRTPTISLCRTDVNRMPCSKGRTHWYVAAPSPILLGIRSRVQTSTPDLPILARFLYRNNVTAIDLKHSFSGHVDIPRLRQGRTAGFFWSVYTSCPKERESDPDYLDPNWSVRCVHSGSG